MASFASPPQQLNNSDFNFFQIYGLMRVWVRQDFNSPNRIRFPRYIKLYIFTAYKRAHNTPIHQLFKFLFAWKFSRVSSKKNKTQKKLFFSQLLFFVFLSDSDFFLVHCSIKNVLFQVVGSWKGSLLFEIQIMV